MASGAGAAPVLRPGRPADPAALADGLPAESAAHREDHEPDAPADEQRQQNGTSEPVPAVQVSSSHSPAGATDTEPAQPGQPETNTDTEAEGERRFAESRQRRLRRLLKQCERLTLLDFNLLAMPAWPDNYALTMARRRRDTWLLCALMAAVVFLSGMTGWVPAWLAGGGFGAFVVILVLGIPQVRRIFSPAPSYLELLMQRQQLIRDARKHIEHLEGEIGLIWQCNELSEFNPTLAAPRFSTLRHLSEQRRLAQSLTRREHIRLYLIFMLEAEKAYERMQNSYFEGHQQAIDRGWTSVAATTIEGRAADKGAGNSSAQGSGEGTDEGRPG